MRYVRSPYGKQIRFVFKGIIIGTKGAYNSIHFLYNRTNMYRFLTVYYTLAQMFTAY